MGLRKPIGPFRVAFADFELSRTSEATFNASTNEQKQLVEESAAAGRGVDQDEEVHPPLFRFYYPTEEKIERSVSWFVVVFNACLVTIQVIPKVAC